MEALTDGQDSTETMLRALQGRAEAMTQGDFSALGLPIGGTPAFEDLRRAIDVLGEHVAQSQRGMHAYIGTLTNAQEAERTRIARDLHDDIVQRLIAVGQSIDRVQRVLDSDVEAGRERLRNVRGDVTAAVQALRSVIANLRPPALEELGLIPAVEFLLRPTGGDQPVIQFAVLGQPQRLDPASELAVFRIVQEAWSNVLQHAHAQHADVTFHYTYNALIITIGDNGRGFVAPQPGAIANGKWGLTGMEERAAQIGGSISIDSLPTRGTTIVVRIPYLGLEGRDPVCDMAVGPTGLSEEYNGRVFRFCSEACRELFLAHPQTYSL